MKLINGRGQVGETLKSRNIESDWIIYHTWNFLDKDEKIQVQEVKQFILFVNKHKAEKIVFISTKAINNNPYVRCKRYAEEYLQKNSNTYKIIRLPNILGRGICQKLKDKTVKPYGDIELIDLWKACEYIEGSILDKRINQTYEVPGTIIPAELLYKIIQF